MTDEVGHVRITWSLEETALVAQEAVRLRVEDPLPHLSGMMERAQQVLPVGRRRKSCQLQQMQPFLRAFNAAWADRLAAAPPPEVVREVQVPMSPGDMLGALWARLEAALAGRPTPTQTLKPKEVTPNPPHKPEPPVVRPVRVAVVGPKPVQIHQLQERLRGVKVDLRNINKDARACPEMFPGSADWAVVWTNFVDHAWDRAAVAAYGKDRVFRVTGGWTRWPTPSSRWPRAGPRLDTGPGPCDNPRHDQSIRYAEPARPPPGRARLPADLPRAGRAHGLLDIPHPHHDEKSAKAGPRGPAGGQPREGRAAAPRPGLHGPQRVRGKCCRRSSGSSSGSSPFHFGS